MEGSQAAQVPHQQSSDPQGYPEPQRYEGKSTELAGQPSPELPEPASSGAVDIQTLGENETVSLTPDG